MQRYAIAAIEEHLKDYQQTFDATWDWKLHPEIMEDVIAKAIRENEAYTKSRNADMRDSIRNKLRTSRTFIDSVLKAAQTIEVGFIVIDPHNGKIKAMVADATIAYSNTA